MATVLAPSDSTENSRPYRSHRFPACASCRRRRTRCIRDANDKPCRSCESHTLTCAPVDLPQRNKTKNAGKAKLRNKRAQQPEIPQTVRSKAQVDRHEPRPTRNAIDHLNGGPSTGDSTVTRQNVSSSSQHDEPELHTFTSGHSGHIIGPVAARDIQLVEEHMPPSTGLLQSRTQNNPYRVYSNNVQNPILYLKVPRSRVRAPCGNGSAGFRQNEAIEKVLDPCGEDVIKLFFEAFHPAFPVLDEAAVLKSYRVKALPHVLVCEIYAVSLISWSKSEKLQAARTGRPDLKYIWSQTVEALNEEFLTPGFSTVLSCILDLVGRPTTSMTYNAINIGRAVALSHTLGLNRKPDNWDLDRRQKAMRVKTWWGVLIQDYWYVIRHCLLKPFDGNADRASRASLAHGTPPHIQSGQFDVEPPTIETLLEGSLESNEEHRAVLQRRVAGALSFQALCRLTKLLGDVLPLVYSTQPIKAGGLIKSLRRIETALDDWTEDLPDFLNGDHIDFQRDQPGALNLHLSFLAVKVYISRVALLDPINSNDGNDRETSQYLLLQCRKSARAIIDFTLTLRETDLHCFWLPYTAYHLAAAANLSLRCGLEAANKDVAHECISAAQSLVDYLRRAKDELDWDLADACLDQCEAVVRELSRARSISQQAGQSSQDYAGSSQRRRRPRRQTNPGINTPITSETGNEGAIDIGTTSLFGSSIYGNISSHEAAHPTQGNIEQLPEANIGSITNSAWDFSSRTDILDPWNIGQDTYSDLDHVF